jgi:hypothetical protein
MMPPSITINRKLKTVTIVMALEKSHPSRSTGKTMLIASTGGVRTGGETYARRPVCFTANVFFYPTNPVKMEKEVHPDLNSDEDDDEPRLRRRSQVLGLALDRPRRPSPVEIAPRKVDRGSGT